MHIASVCLFLTLVSNMLTISIPYIQNVFLQSSGYSQSNTTIYLNITCQQCLCIYFNGTINNNYLALNCFNNNTYQYFNTYPTSYTLQSSSGAKVYFIQKIFPNISTCCKPNITELFTRLQNATPKMIHLNFSPNAFGYDENQSDEAVVIGSSVGNLYWFNPFNLTFIRNNSIWTSTSVVLYNGSLFTSIDGNLTIYVLNIQTMAQITEIFYPTLVEPRKYIFLNNGTTMIATAQTNYSLTVFNVISSTNYTFQQLIPFPYINLHSLAKVNDTFFYASTWQNTTMVTYSYINTTWNYTLFVSPIPGVEGSHITLDDCGRIWKVIYSFDLYIYDSSGIHIASWNITLGADDIFDIIILPNYVLLLTQVTAKKILQYDPTISCS